MRPVVERLLSRVEVVPGPLSSACWVWRGGGKRNGYGVIGLGSRSDGSKRTELVHRVAYEAWVGELVEGLTIDHLCRNRRCVCPEHLEQVSNRENILRGVGWAAVNARVERCPDGHEYTPENTYTSRRGMRSCRACHRVREGARKARLRGGP